MAFTVLAWFRRTRCEKGTTSVAPELFETEVSLSYRLWSCPGDIRLLHFFDGLREHNVSDARSNRCMH